jgi:hypothetical protein
MPPEGAPRRHLDECRSGFGRVGPAQRRFGQPPVPAFQGPCPAPSGGLTEASEARRFLTSTEDLRRNIEVALHPYEVRSRIPIVEFSGYDSSVLKKQHKFENSVNCSQKKQVFS